VIRNLSEGSLNIATGTAEMEYRLSEEGGLVTRPADLTEELRRKLEALSKRIYRQSST
jgi:hypothetical protein